MYSKYLENQPQSHTSEELEEKSFDALRITLPKDKFIFRDERTKDNGVDGSLEVKFNGKAVNFRAQFQLKAKNTRTILKDGSVSCSVKTSNLNHLLNNPLSLYFLYIESKNEIRFVWTKDELKRLDDEIPKWNEQKNITLRFVQTLTEITLEQIHERIINEGGLLRRINETLVNNAGNNLRLEIEQPNLEVTDGKQAQQILDYYGIELLNSGYENFVLEKYELLSNSEKKKPKFLLLKSRAEGLLGKYRAALDTLGIIDLMIGKLSPTEKFHFESIENHSKWMLGQINTEQFLAKLQELSTNELAKNSILDKFNFLFFSLMYKEDYEVNTSDLFNKIKILKSVGEEILLDKSFSQAIKVNIEFSILENELKWLVMEQTSLLGEGAIYEETKVFVPEYWDRNEKFPAELKRWVDKSNELLNKAQNVTIKADISYLQIRLWFYQNQSYQFWSTNTGKEYSVDKAASDSFIEQLQTVISIYTDYNQNYSIIRAKMLMVELLSLIGRSEESEILRKEINRQANTMSYEALKNLTEFSLHKTLYGYSQTNKTKKDI